MNIGALKTTIWYKCLVCHSFFQSPKALVVHRMKSKCRSQYKKIHKARSKWPFETPLLENLDQEETSGLNDSQQLLKSPKTIEKATEPTDNFSNEAKASVPELGEKSINLDLIQVASCNSDPLNPLLKNQITNFEDPKNQVVYHTRENAEVSLNCDNNGMSSDEVKLICNLCQKSYSTKQYLNFHISTVHEKLKLYLEQRSNKVDSSVPELPEKSRNLDLNQVASFNIDPENPLPKSQITNFEDLKNQVVYHTRKKPDDPSLNLDNCKKDDMRTDEVNVHKTSSKYICNLCQKSYCSKEYLNIHISTVHEKLKPCSCNQCPKSFGKISTLQAHISFVHERRKLNCKQCAKTFVTKQCLERHVSAVHQGLKPFSCKECPRSFSQLGALNLHISNVHEKLKPHSCTECSKTFGLKQYLKMHVS